MSTKKYLLVVFYALGIIVVGVFGAFELDALSQPNIVVIMTDDQTLESLRVMQKTKTLIGNAGTTFKNFFVDFPLCCPSRATFLTGQYTHNHKVLSNNAPSGGYSKLNHANTLPVWLQNAGYYTIHIGKYLNEYGLNDPFEIPPGWDDWQTLVDAGDTLTYYDYTINDNGTLVTYGSAAADYQTDVLAGRAVTAINERAVRSEPFFLTISVLAPHIDETPGVARALPAPRHKGIYAQEPLPQNPSFNEADVSDKPAFIRKRPLLSTSAQNTVKARYRARLESLLAVDDLVERVVNALRSSNQLNDTVIFFTSDNGFFHGEHRIPNGKEKVYEEAIRVPLMVRGGGFPAGAVAKQYVSNIDLAPTIVKLAGASPTVVMDGRSLLPLAQNPTLGQNRSLLIQGMPSYKAVRTQNYIYVEYKTSEKELYDLAKDPYQLVSRHNDPAYTQIKQDLQVKLSKLRTCSGLSCSQGSN